MELHDRLRLLRKNYLHLTQAEFGEKLGVNRTVIKNIELNLLARPEQKEPLLRLICKTFGVNYEWLKDGVGEWREGYTKQIHERIYELRNNYLCLSQAEFGKQLGVTATTISKIESGERAATKQMIIAICKVFNVSEAWLKSGVGEWRGGGEMENKYSRTTGDEDINILLHEHDRAAKIEAAAKEMIDVMKKHDLAFFEADEALRTCGIMLRLSVKVI